MSKESLFKETQIYGWDVEPVDERPSEFTASSGYSVMSHDSRIGHPHRARRSSSSVSLIALVVFCTVLIGLCAYALVEWLPRLTHR